MIPVIEARRVVEVLEDELEPPKPVGAYSSGTLGLLRKNGLLGDPTKTAAAVFLLNCWLVDADISAAEIATATGFDEETLVDAKDRIWERRADWYQGIDPAPIKYTDSSENR